MRGEELPKEYSHAHDPFVALTAAAWVTKKIKLGTGVCLGGRTRPDRIDQERSLDSGI